MLNLRQGGVVRMSRPGDRRSRRNRRSGLVATLMTAVVAVADATFGAPGAAASDEPPLTVPPGVAAAGHRKISMVGHSQGGMIGRWALRYWPDTRALVDDYVGLASSNHDTAEPNFSVQCPTLGCDAANWQQRTGSNFLTALNSGRRPGRGSATPRSPRATTTSWCRRPRHT